MLMDLLNKELIEASDAFSNNELEKALRILRPLADKMIAGVLALLDVMFQLGEGVKQNGAKAVELSRKLLN